MKKRFFGLHFDFHAAKGQKGIGSKLDPEFLRTLLRETKPDFVQCDTKGHGGVSSYPTKVGNACAGIDRDILEVWRQVTAQEGVALYAHHSGVWDNLALEKHPEWAVKDETGKSSAEKTSVFGPYADELLIPQLKEIALKYGLDGAWIDGECWAAVPDYSEYAAEKFRKMYGKEPPRSGEPDYDLYLDFNRQGFRDYVSHYCREVKSVAPDFALTSNWLCSSYVPEDSANFPVDFASGDYLPSNSYLSARFESRFLMGQNKPWDLMAWGFRFDEGFSLKTPEQIEQEAAATVALGGGFQLYNPQSPTDCVRDGWAVPQWAQVSRFCREREQFCFGASPVSDAAIVHSLKGFYHNKRNFLFTTYDSPYTKDLAGTLHGQLDNGFSLEVLMTHRFEEDFSKYRLITVTNLTDIEPSLKEKLIRYAQGGGTLLVSGADTVGLFQEELGVKAVGKCENKVFFFESKNGKLPIKVPLALLEPEDCTVTGRGNLEGETVVAAVKRKLGRGRIVGIAFNYGLAYSDRKSSHLRDFLREVLSDYTPGVRVTGSKLVDVAHMRKDGAQYVHLVNTAGAHENANAVNFDEIPPLYNLTAEIDCERAPKSVSLMPANRPARFVYKDGILTVWVDRLDVHTAIRWCC